MKRITLFAVIAALILSAAAVSVSAIDFVEPVGAVSVPCFTKAPVLDGDLSEWDENAAFIISDWNMKAVVASGYTDVSEGFNSKFHLAWDDTYFYVAAETHDPTFAARKDKGEGDYFRMFIDFGPTVLSGTRDSTCAFAFCLCRDYSEGGNHDDVESVSLFLVAASTGTPQVQYTGDKESYGIKYDKENMIWTFEGRIAWADLLAAFEANTGVKINPAAGLEANATIVYVDFDENYKQINWFGTTLSGYEVPARWIPEEYGIQMTFLAPGAVVEPRPETTFPEETTVEETTKAETTKSETTAADEETTDSAATSADTTADETTGTDVTTNETTDDEGGNKLLLPIIIGAVVVVAAIVAIVIISKKKKNA